MKKYLTKKNLIIISIALIIIVGVSIIDGNPNNINTGIFSKEKVNIVLSEASKLQLVDYTCNEFTMKVPYGWKVETGGTEMFYAIKVYDPLDERNQIFVLLKAEPLLKSTEAKNFQTNYYNITKNELYKALSNAIVLNPPTVENFYTNFDNYAQYAEKDVIYPNFKFPFISVFRKIEEFESNSYMKSVSLDDKTIRATFENHKGEAEGLFAGTVVGHGNIMFNGIDLSFNSMYNVIFISSKKDEFINYKDILLTSLSSLNYTANFINATNRAIVDKTEAAIKANQTVTSAFDSYNRAWNARQKTYDITSQKYSDATFGYIRVKDKENGDIYKAYNGFMDDYKGKRYEVIDDNDYSSPIKGYIEK